MPTYIDYTQRPPSTGTSIPVKKFASSLPKKAQVLPTSDGVEPRPRGIVVMKTFSFSGLPRKKSVLYMQSAYDCAPAGSKSLQSSTQTHDRAHAVETNVVWCVFHSHRLRGVDYSSLGGIVPRQSSPRPETCCRSDCDERSAILLLLQIWHKDLSREVDGSHIDSEDLIVFLLRDLTRGLCPISTLLHGSGLS